MMKNGSKTESHKNFTIGILIAFVCATACIYLGIDLKFGLGLMGTNLVSGWAPLIITVMSLLFGGIGGLLFSKGLDRDRKFALHSSPNQTFFQRNKGFILGLTGLTLMTVMGIGLALIAPVPGLGFALLQNQLPTPIVFLGFKLIGVSVISITGGAIGGLAMEQGFYRDRLNNKSEMTADIEKTIDNQTFNNQNEENKEKLETNSALLFQSQNLSNQKKNIAPHDETKEPENTNKVRLGSSSNEDTQ